MTNLFALVSNWPKAGENCTKIMNPNLYFFWFALRMKHMLSGGKRAKREGQSVMGHIDTLTVLLFTKASLEKVKRIALFFFTEQMKQHCQQCLLFSAKPFIYLASCQN